MIPFVDPEIVAAIETRLLEAASVAGVTAFACVARDAYDQELDKDETIADELHIAIHHYVTDELRVLLGAERSPCPFCGAPGGGEKAGTIALECTCPSCGYYYSDGWDWRDIAHGILRHPAMRAAAEAGYALERLRDRDVVQTGAFLEEP